MKDNNYWLKLWESNYLPFHVENVHSDLISYLPQLNLPTNAHILVPLCGKSQDMFWLVQQGYQVTGIELSPIACQDFFAERNLKPHITKTADFSKYQHENITLLSGDFFKVKSTDLPPIHAVFDCKALIALPHTVRREYVNHLLESFGREIKILLFVIESDNKTLEPPFSVGTAEINILYGEQFNIKHLKRTLDHNIPDNLVKKGVTQKIDHVYLLD